MLEVEGMLSKLEQIEKKYEELTKKISDPKVISNRVEFSQSAKERADLEEIVGKFREYKKIREELEKTNLMLEEELDQELKSLAEEELKGLSLKKDNLKEELKSLLISKNDEEGEKDVIVEIRSGTGGEEASLFAGDLLRMYTRFAEQKRWKIDFMNSNPTGLGGFKEIVFAVKGKGAYKVLKFESGIHRVQRIPVTESGGRLHTSAATVAVLPEVKETEIKINSDDLRIDTYRASSAGGQHVNKTSSAVRITHLPSGIVVTCQDERSQHQNREKAMHLLRAHLKMRMKEKQQREVAQNRKSQVGSGDRSEKIRTYNCPQERVTDHRIGLSLYRLKAILDGDLEEITQALIKAEENKKVNELKS